MVGGGHLNRVDLDPSDPQPDAASRYIYSGLQQLLSNIESLSTDITIGGWIYIAVRPGHSHY